jgi:hypothetical protein
MQLLLRKGNGVFTGNFKSRLVSISKTGLRLMHFLNLVTAETAKTFVLFLVRKMLRLLKVDGASLRKFIRHRTHAFSSLPGRQLANRKESALSQWRRGSALDVG